MKNQRQNKSQLREKVCNQQGATAVIIAILMFVFLALTALAVDLSHLYVVRGELQNAADAGALAGARVLYNNQGTAINTGANQVAFDAAVSNTSEKMPVEVSWTGGNSGDVQRGHWRFADRTFIPNASTVPVSLWNVSSAELDANTDFINAVRVTTRRSANPAVSFFARIFGETGFQMQASAVAYIGFTGTLLPLDVDQPIAICRESIVNAASEYDCSIGRMINSGQDDTSNETGGWTNFSQENACTGGTNSQEVRDLVCGGGNPDTIALGGSMATNGGEIQSAFNDLINCWQSATGTTQPWKLTLPVVSCPSNNVGTCETVKGAVTVNVVWITGAGEDPGYINAPTRMGDWSSNDPDGWVRWQSFVSEEEGFNLKNQDGSPAPYAKKSIYFQPDCTYHEPAGGSGGENFGVLAQIPVLVD